MEKVQHSEREIELSLLRRKHRVQLFATKNERPAETQLEKQLWRIAKMAPYGGMYIPLTGEDPYLLRIYLTPGGARLHLPLGLKKDVDHGVGAGARPYLHYFFRGDGDKEFHNHPWRVSYSWILAGGYVEHKLNPKTREIEKRVFRPGAFNVIRREDYHWVELLDPKAGCWTLFLSVDRLQKSDGTDWGFLDIETGEYTPWGEYTKNREPTSVRSIST
jgi:hypothetical protein